MKRSDFILIQAPMVTDLKLSGNRLIIYALIHGFCKDGEHEFKGSINYICEWTNITRNTVISTLKSLVDDGLISKREYSANNVKFCAYSIVVGSAKTAPVVQNLFEIGNGGSAKTAPQKDNNNYNTDNNKEENILIAESEVAFIDRMYAKYPSRCPVRNISTGKSMKDKQRIKTLLKTYSMKDIERVIDKEIEVKYGKYRMQNFSTFLNNFPDPNSLFDDKASGNVNEMSSNDGIVVNGQIYR